jgi:hypothetical protein
MIRSSVIVLHAISAVNKILRNGTTYVRDVLSTALVCHRHIEDVTYIFQVSFFDNSGKIFLHQPL